MLPPGVEPGSGPFSESPKSKARKNLAQLESSCKKEGVQLILGSGVFFQQVNTTAREGPILDQLDYRSSSQ